MTDTSPLPVVFLNPAVLLPLLVPTVGPDGFTITGVRNAAPQTNGSAERLNALFRYAGAAPVLTTVAGLGNVFERLDRIGLRAVFHANAVLDAAQPDTAAAVADWLDRNGNPLCAIVDRSGVAPAVTIRVDVEVGDDVPAAACCAAAFALGATEYPFR